MIAHFERRPGEEPNGSFPFFCTKPKAPTRHRATPVLAFWHYYQGACGPTGQCPLHDKRTLPQVKDQPTGKSGIECTPYTAGSFEKSRKSDGFQVVAQAIRLCSLSRGSDKVIIFNCLCRTQANRKIACYLVRRRAGAIVFRWRAHRQRDRVGASSSPGGVPGNQPFNIGNNV